MYLTLATLPFLILIGSARATEPSPGKPEAHVFE
jgi:hypothetical protein